MSAPPDIDDWIREIKSKDHLTYEAAYHSERPSGPVVMQRLLCEMQAAEDGYTRGKFVELLGEIGDISVVPRIIPELRHPDQNVRQWAVTALRQLRGHGSRRSGS